MEINYSKSEVLMMQEIFTKALKDDKMPEKKRKALQLLLDKINLQIDIMY